MRKILLSLISAAALVALAGCGTSSNRTIEIPSNPSGGNTAGLAFSNASLALGTSYVFTAHGFNNNNNFAVVGSFVTDGNGSITSGTRDTVNDRGDQTLGEAITGTYFVNLDGRGQAVLNGNSGQVIYRFVLHSPTAQQPTVVGELFQDGTTSDSVLVDAVGTIQQVSGAAAVPAGSYIVRLDGEDGNRNIYGVVGELNFAANVSGSIDENDNGIFSSQLAVSSGSMGNFTNGRATASYTTSKGSHKFVVDFVSPTHLELVGTDGNFLLYGSADQQSGFSANTAAFTGSQVFSLTGYDINGARAEVGRVTLNGDGSVGSAVEDYDTAASPNVFSDVSLAGSTYAVGSNGRWTGALADSTTDLVGWQISPAKSVVLAYNPTSTILETGVMVGQSLGVTTASVSGNYAESFAGPSELYGEVEYTGNLAASTGAFNGTYDEQGDSLGLFLDTGTAGNYAFTDVTTGRGTGNIDGINVVLYAVDANTIYVISSQRSEIYQGALVSQP